MTAIPAGMVAWSGGESAPEDWDGGPVLLRCGREFRSTPGRWTHRKCASHYDIIAYTPKPARTDTPAGDAEARAREVLSKHFKTLGTVKYDEAIAAMLAFAAEAVAAERDKPCKNCGFLPEKAGRNDASNTVAGPNHTALEARHG